MVKSNAQWNAMVVLATLATRRLTVGTCAMVRFDFCGNINLIDADVQDHLEPLGLRSEHPCQRVTFLAPYRVTAPRF